MSNTTITPNAGAVAAAGVALAMGLALTPGAGAQNLAGNSPLIYPVVPALNANQNGGTWTYTWSGLINGSTGQPTGVSPAPFHYDSAYMQLSGTFGSGGSCQLEGSLDGANWTILSIGAKTQAALAAFGAGEQPNYVRPHVTAGDTTTNLGVVLQFARVH